MIKLIIFDLDNTLINTSENLELEYQKLIDKFDINITAKDLYRVIGYYEDSDNIYYDKGTLINLINKNLNLNLDITFLDKFFEVYNELVSNVDDSIIDTLKYLKKKYKLVILTNWFTDSQVARLKKAGILEYFDGVYGGDIVPMKPIKESFLSVIENLKPDECVMVGDNLDVDIRIPFEMGFNVYYLNKYEKTNYPTIKSIEELKEML